MVTGHIRGGDKGVFSVQVEVCMHKQCRLSQSWGCEPLFISGVKARGAPGLGRPPGLTKGYRANTWSELVMIMGG